MAGGSVGAKINEGNKIVIGVSLDKFSSNTKPSSLHESVQSYFVNTKCSNCQEFVGQIEIRRLYCKTFTHRDVMAGHNIYNVKGHLLYQGRTSYLVPDRGKDVSRVDGGKKESEQATSADRARGGAQRQQENSH